MPTGSWERQRRRTTLALLAAPAAAMLVLFVAPLAQLLWLSVGGGGATFSLAAYGALLRPVYLRLLLFTLELAAASTLLCLLLGYPVAYLLATMDGRQARWMRLALLVALWLSVLARTYSWIIILQRNGIVNRLLEGAGLIDRPLSLLYNETGVLIGMAHILLPFMVLTLVPSLAAIDPALIRAALSLGARPRMAFWRIVFRLSLPGVMAGSILVFTMALGFFITPAILGGGRTTTIVMAIVSQVEQLVDLPLASATSITLLVISLAILVAYERIAGVERVFGARR